MTPDFETNKSTWSIRATIGELIDVISAVMSINRTGTNESCVWLTKVPNGPRLWIIRERIVTAWVIADGESTDPTFALPLPDRFIHHLIEVASDDGGVDIFCNEVEGTIIGRGVNRFISTDHPKDIEFTERDMPYLGRIHGHHVEPAVAAVAMSDMQLFSEIALDLPRNVDLEETRILPFVSMSIGGGQLAWTMDWRRHDAGRTTGAIPARTDGTADVTFYPYILARFLKSRDEDDDARIFVDAQDSEYLYIVSDKWGVRVVCDREELARWGGALRTRLTMSEVDVEEHVGERIPDFVPFTLQGQECFASIHVKDDGVTEYVRLTHISTQNTPHSAAVFQEINALNESLYGVRVVLRDGEIRIIAEFSVRAMADFDSHMNVFAAALDRCRNLNVFLPLFTDSH